MSALDTQIGGGHYKDMAIQPVEYIHANGIPFIEGCVIKYVSRWKSKGGVADLEKARHFIDLLIEMQGRNPVTLVFPALTPAQVAQMEEACAASDRLTLPVPLVKVSDCQLLGLPVRGEVG